MKLYSYNHCPFCIRARMIFALTETPYEYIALLNDDEETPIKMIGKKQVPILEIEQGKYMAESLDIVEFIDKNHKVLGGSRNKAIETWVSEATSYLYKLIFPRVIKQDFPEFATASAINYFKEKKENAMKMTFEEALALTPELKEKAESHMKELSPLITKLPSVKNKDFSLDDIILFPVLMLLTSVYGLKWEKNVQDYVRHISGLIRIPILKAI